MYRAREISSGPDVYQLPTACSDSPRHRCPSKLRVHGLIEHRENTWEVSNWKTPATGPAVNSARCWSSNRMVSSPAMSSTTMTVSLMAASPTSDLTSTGAIVVDQQPYNRVLCLLALQPARTEIPRFVIGPPLRCQWCTLQKQYRRSSRGTFLQLFPRPSHCIVRICGRPDANSLKRSPARCCASEKVCVQTSRASAIAARSAVQVSSTFFKRPHLHLGRPQGERCCLPLGLLRVGVRLYLGDPRRMLPSHRFERPCWFLAAGAVSRAAIFVVRHSVPGGRDSGNVCRASPHATNDLSRLPSLHTDYALCRES